MWHWLGHFAHSLSPLEPCVTRLCQKCRFQSLTRKKNPKPIGVCVFTAVCAACVWAEGRTAHQPIHGTAQRFLGGGSDSEREGSKKSSDNYPQLWTLLCHLLLRHRTGGKCSRELSADAASTAVCWPRRFSGVCEIKSMQALRLCVCVCVCAVGGCVLWQPELKPA